LKAKEIFEEMLEVRLKACKEAYQEEFSILA